MGNKARDSVELVSPRPIPIPHRILSYEEHDEPEEPSYHGRSEQKTGRSGQNRYQFQRDDEASEASQRQILHGSDTGPSMAALNKPTDLTGNLQHEPRQGKATNISRRRIYHDDSDDGDDGEYVDPALAPLRRRAGRSPDYRTANPSRRQLYAHEDDEEYVLAMKKKPQPNKHFNADLGFPITSGASERELPRRRAQDVFTKELEQSRLPETSKNLSDFLDKELQPASRLSRNTTISYMVEQANKASQDSPKLLPALPIVPATKKKRRPAPLDIKAAEASDRVKPIAVRGTQLTEKPKWRPLKIKQELRGAKLEQREAKQERREDKPEQPRPTSSVYSQPSMPFKSSAKVSPLHINKLPDTKGDMFEDYGRWHGGKEPRTIPKSLTMPEIDDIRQVSPYTPLTPWLDRDPDFRKGKKTMVRYNGWLENAAIESRKKPEPKKPGILNAFRKKVQGFVSIPLPYIWFTYFDPS